MVGHNGARVQIAIVNHSLVCPQSLALTGLISTMSTGGGCLINDK